MSINIARTLKEFIPSWNGNKESDNPIIVSLKPISSSDYWDLIAISAEIQSASTNNDYSKVKNTLNKLAPIFEKNIKSITNLTIDDKAIVLKNLGIYPELLSLNSEIMAELLVRVSLTKEEEKNLIEPSEANLQ